jgi:protein arginine kinase activator
MNCQVCQKNDATVHITELPLPFDPSGETTVSDKHICVHCAQELDLPHLQVMTKDTMDIWKLLQLTAKRPRPNTKLSCPDCGMTLEEFRRKGRLGCPNDYEVFRTHLDALLQRMHNATEHTGRIPGVNESELERRQQISTLRERLEVAIREEAYEAAAELRDELKTLQEG